jgi:predicted transcriptional regulator
MEITEVLAKVGLNQKEADVYIALLGLGSASVETIAKKSGTARATTYLVLSNLQKQGLVSQVPQNKKTLFTAESPEKILASLNKQTELVQRVLPDMLALYNEKKEKPRAQLFQGKEGVREVYNIMFTAPEGWFFGTINGIMKIDPEGLKAFMRRARKLGFKIHDLVGATPTDMVYVKEMQGPTYESRIIPPGLTTPSDSGIFGDNVVFFSFHPMPFAVLITSKDIAHNLRTLFELGWRSSLTIEQFEKQETKKVSGPF